MTERKTVTVIECCMICMHGEPVNSDDIICNLVGGDRIYESHNHLHWCKDFEIEPVYTEAL